MMRKFLDQWVRYPLTMSALLVAMVGATVSLALQQDVNRALLWLIYAHLLGKDIQE